MHPSVRRAFSEIDAALFNGDTFEDDEARQDLIGYIERWRRRLGLLDGNSIVDAVMDADIAALPPEVQKARMEATPNPWRDECHQDYDPTEFEFTVYGDTEGTDVIEMLNKILARKRITIRDVSDERGAEDHVIYRVVEE